MRTFPNRKLRNPRNSSTGGLPLVGSSTIVRSASLIRRFRSGCEWRISVAVSSGTLSFMRQAHRKNNRPKTGDLKVRRSCFRVDDGAEIRSRTEQVIEADNGLLAIDPHLVESRPIPGRRLLPFSVCATPTSCSAAAPRRCAGVPARPWRSPRPRTPGRSATRCPGCGPTPRRPSPACRGARSGRR